MHIFISMDIIFHIHYEVFRFHIKLFRLGAIKFLFYDKNNKRFLLNNTRARKFHFLKCKKFWRIDFVKSALDSFILYYSLAMTNMYLWSVLLESPIDKCTIIHLFEDNSAFHHELVFMLPLILIAIEK